jgi:signal transduction histidine kinase
MVLAVCLLGLAVAALALVGSSAVSLGRLMLWSAAFILAEAMWLRAPGGRGTVSMASSLHLASLPFLLFGELVLAAWFSRLTVNLVLQRKSWHQALFNGAQLSLAVAAAYQVGVIVTGSWASLLTTGPILMIPLVIIACAVSYYLVNTGLVCGYLSLASGDAFWRIWRLSYGYRSGIVSTAALFLLAPAVVIAYIPLGIIGLAVFILPIWFIRKNWLENVKLDETHCSLMESARSTAKGELAARLGIELRSHVDSLAAGLKQLETGAATMSAEERRLHLQQISARVQQMSALSKGLTDFPLLRTHRSEVDIETLVREALSFVQVQVRYMDTCFEASIDPKGGTVCVDVRQIELALIELLQRAAYAVRDVEPTKRRVLVRAWWQTPDRELLLSVFGDGRHTIRPRPAPRSNAGAGRAERTYELQAVRQIVKNHGGALEVEEEREGKVGFTIRLPARLEQDRPAA